MIFPLNRWLCKNHNGVNQPRWIRRSIKITTEYKKMYIQESLNPQGKKQWTVTYGMKCMDILDDHVLLEVRAQSSIGILYCDKKPSTIFHFYEWYYYVRMFKYAYLRRKAGKTVRFFSRYRPIQLFGIIGLVKGVNCHSTLFS